MTAHTNQLVNLSSLSTRVRTVISRISLWTVALLLSLICIGWGLVALFSGRFHGPERLGIDHALLMTAIGLICYVYAFLGRRFSRR